MSESSSGHSADLRSPSNLLCAEYRTCSGHSTTVKRFLAENVWRNESPNSSSMAPTVRPCNLCQAWSSSLYRLTSNPPCLLTTAAQVPWHTKITPIRPSPYRPDVLPCGLPACLSARPPLAEGSLQPLLMQGTQQGKATSPD